MINTFSWLVDSAKCTGLTKTKSVTEENVRNQNDSQRLVYSSWKDQTKQWWKRYNHKNSWGENAESKLGKLSLFTFKQEDSGIWSPKFQ